MDDDEWARARTPKAFQNLGNELTLEDRRCIADMLKAPPMRAGGSKNTRKEWAQFFEVEREKVPPTPFDAYYFEPDKWAAHCRRAMLAPEREQPGRVGVDMSNPHIVATTAKAQAEANRTGSECYVHIRNAAGAWQRVATVVPQEVGFGREQPAKPAPEPLPKGATRHPAIGAQCFALPDPRAFMLGRDV